MERIKKTPKNRDLELLTTLFTLLLDHFGPQGWWPVSIDGKNAPVYRNGYFGPLTEEQRFEISVGAILTQNTSWTNVVKALERLRSKNMLSFNALRSASASSIKKCIQPAGYFNQKTMKLKFFMDFLASGKPIQRENLLAVWGIGPETADSILLYAYQQSIFVIDAYTKRIMERIGFNEREYEALQHLFHAQLSSDHVLFNEFHALFVELGKKCCTKSNPSCSQCPLQMHCAYGQEGA